MHVCLRVGTDDHKTSGIFSQLIAVNTFYILFLNMDPPKLMLIAMLFGGWSLIFTLVIAGPATMNTGKDGSFCMCFLFVVVVLVF